MNYEEMKEMVKNKPNKTWEDYEKVYKVLLEQDALDEVEVLFLDTYEKVMG